MSLSPVVILEATSRELRKQRIAQRRDRALSGIAEHLTGKLSKVFEKQGRLFIGSMEIYRHRFSESVSEDEWADILKRIQSEQRDEMTLPVVNGQVQALRAGGHGALLDTQLAAALTFDLTAPEVTTWLAEQSSTLITRIDETTRNRVREILTGGITERKSWTKIAKDLRDEFQFFASGIRGPLHLRSRAELIAVTELRFAYEKGGELAAKRLTDLGIKINKEWLTVGDDRVSAMDREAEAEGLVPEDWVFGHGFGYPPSHPGCRCTVVRSVGV